LYQLRNSAKVRGELATLLPIDTVTLSKITLLLNDSKTDIRISAAYLLDALKDKSALNALLKSTQDQDGMVRLFSIRAIGNLEKLDALDKNTLLPKLVGAVQDSSYLVRTEAWLTMTKLQIVPEVLQQIGSQFELLKQDKNAHVRSVIVDALASQATATPDLFDEFLKDSGALVRARAVVARSQLLKDHLIDFLQQTLQDSSWWVRSKTADVIDSLPAVVKETFIFEAIKDSAVQVRVNTILNLVNTTTPLVITLVENKLKSKDLSERYSALATIYSQQQPNMMTLLNDCYLNSQEKKFQDIRTDIISIFASVNTAETTSYLKTALSDINPRLAYSAYKELKNRAVPDLAPMNEPIPDLIPGSFSTFKRNPKLIINTSRGFFVIELYPQYAPFHVSRVVDVARRGEYDGLVWHRVENNFVIQGGDPEKTGWGVGKDIIRAEINPLRFKRGSLGMPRSTDWDSGGTQLFINHVPTPRLDGLYTLFGQVIQGMDVVDNIQPGDSIIKVTVQY
jgi:cyclophilin family peptidyl-prolyl cis-trans isomerase/HEAT repeat protein